MTDLVQCFRHWTSPADLAPLMASSTDCFFFRRESSRRRVRIARAHVLSQLKPACSKMEGCQLEQSMMMSHSARTKRVSARIGSIGDSTLCSSLTCHSVGIDSYRISPTRKGPESNRPSCRRFGTYTPRVNSLRNIASMMILTAGGPLDVFLAGHPFL